MARHCTSLEEVIREDFLQCTICTELYQTPKILPCLHSYCKHCLEPLVAEGSLRCPECRQSVAVNKGVQSLKTNFFIESLVELFQPRHLTGHECSICIMSEMHVPATSRCLDCRDFLCQTCSKGHSCTRLTLNHCVVDLIAYLDGQYDAEVRIRQTMYCPDHEQEPLKFFCESCNTLICRDCCFLNHRQHEVASMTDAVQKKRPEVKKLIDSLQDKISLLLGWEEGIDESLQMLETAGEKIQEDLTTYVADVIAVIQSKRDETLGQLDAFLKQEKDALITIKHELSRQKEKAVSSREFSQKVMDFGKDPEILFMEDMMRQRLKEFQSFSLQQRNSRIIKLKLNGKQALSKTQFYNMNICEENSGDRRLSPSYYADTMLEEQPSCNLTSVGSSNSTESPSAGNQPENSTILHSDKSKPSELVSVSAKSTVLLLDSSPTTPSQSENSQSSNFQKVTCDSAIPECQCPLSTQSLTGERQINQQQPEQGLLSVAQNRLRSIRRFDLRGVSDTCEAKITGIAVPPGTGDIFLVDRHNKEIKCFSSTGTLIRTIKVEDTYGLPCSITVCGDFLACSASYLLFYTLEGKYLKKMQLRKSGPDPQYAITSYKSSYVAVSEGTHCTVALYSTKGHRLDRIQPCDYSDGKFLFIAINSREEFIVSDQVKQHVVIFKRSGDLVCLLNSTNSLIRKPFTLCVDNNNHIFVRDEYKLIWLEDNGLSGQVLRTGPLCGPSKPRLLAFDVSGHIILVQTDNFITVNELY